MNLVTWAFPARILFGEGAIQRIGLEAHQLGGSRALVVADPGVVSARLAGTVQAALEEAGVVTSLFTEIHPNPTEEDVTRGVQALRSKGADLVVGVGGGSTLDVAKLIGLRAVAGVNDRALADYDEASGGGRHIRGPMPPMIAVPTTAGTGSEVARSAVVTLSGGRKVTISSSLLQPSVALLDPRMTMTMPPRLTATTGFEALAHNLEAYLAQGDHPICDAVALGGLRLSAEHLERATHQGEDLGARGGMMKAAMMGAVARQKGLGAAQALAHALTSHHGVPLGVGLALVLPAVVEFSATAAGERLAHVATALGLEGRAADVASALRSLRGRLALPSTLAEVGVAAEALAALADQAATDAAAAAGPLPAGRAELLALARACA